MSGLNHSTKRYSRDIRGIFKRPRTPCSPPRHIWVVDLVLWIEKLVWLEMRRQDQWKRTELIPGPGGIKIYVKLEINLQVDRWLWRDVWRHCLGRDDVHKVGCCPCTCFHFIFCQVNGSIYFPHSLQYHLSFIFSPTPSFIHFLDFYFLFFTLLFPVYIAGSMRTR